MNVSVDPPLDEPLRAEIVALLQHRGTLRTDPVGYGAAWRLAGLQEGVERERREEPEPGYALSPRSTRGATRA